MSNFLQSQYWQEFQESLGRKSIIAEGNGWSYRAYVESGRASTRLYVPRGPLISDSKTLERCMKELVENAKANSATFIRVEPEGDITTQDLRKRGFVRVARVQPEVTSIVDLHDSEDSILARMSQPNRNRYRTGEKKGLTFHTSNDPKYLDDLMRLLNKVSARSGLASHSHEYLKKQVESFVTSNVARFFVVICDGIVVGVSFGYDFETTRYYAHAAADDDYRKLSIGAYLVAHMIIDAKRSGLLAVDLCGIWPHAKDGTAEYGITKFKRAFGGEDVEYHGTWELPVSKVQYGIYSLLRKFTKQRV